MIGLVLVSHSPELARAALVLASQMAHGADRPRVALAAGASDGSLGTDAVRVSEAIAEVASPDGVLVLMDLGSAVLSAEMALELTADPTVTVRLTEAPFVEGSVAALVSAASGADLETVEREARSALRPKSAQLGDQTAVAESASTEAPRQEREPGALRSENGPGSGPDRGGAAETEFRLVNPAGLHARPAALVVETLSGIDATVSITNLRTGTRVADASSMMSLLTLGARQGDAVHLHATGREAQRAIDVLSALASDGFGERSETAPAGDAGLPSPPSAGDEQAAPGTGPIGVSAGRAVGTAVHMPEPVPEPVAHDALPEHQRRSEAERIGAALRAVQEHLADRARQAEGRGSGHDAREILEATSLLAGDQAIVEAARNRVIELGERAERAIWVSLTGLSEQLAAQGGRMAERVADVRDVRDRAVAELRGDPMSMFIQPESPFVLLARDLAPADTALLDPKRCVGLVTAEGGPTSHTAILARSLGIPAVVAAPEALAIPDGVLVLVDGSRGEVIPDPPAELVASIQTAPSIPAFGGEGRTADGARIELLANIGSADEASGAHAARAQGVGLFRTEFCFLDRVVAPTRREQTDAYRAVFAAFDGRKVVIRTLDAGADKPLPFLTSTSEPNPALGVRGYRTSWRRPDILDDQLAAIAEAARRERADVWVMAPMIDTVAEARDFVRRCRDHGLTRAGVMIETPAAALSAPAIIDAVDFVSIGTNDLTQYTMAADRLVGELAALNDSWQPAVLRLIGLIGEAGRAHGKPVGVCGEAGGDPALAPVLVGLGVTSLSMTPRAIAAVADSLGRSTSASCREAAAIALDATGSAEARRAVGAFLAG